LSEGSSRAALVTGASQGLGRVIATRMAQAGFTVVLTARNRKALESVAQEVSVAGGQALVFPADLAEPDDIARLVAAVEQEVGALDALINNCGIAGPTGLLWELEPADWQETFTTNVTAVFHLCRGLIPAMLARKSGSVVVIGSASGKRPLPTRTPYAASKAALIGLVRSLAWEVGPHGVRVNLVSPGPVVGERLEQVFERMAPARGISPDDLRAQMLASAALERFTEPDDVAEAVLFLASERSRAITGEDLNVSSGWVMHG
jgi:NAD(P)-dependent dehydrogenase (short-subunit alcohol dehydrogenase family)